MCHTSILDTIYIHLEWVCVIRIKPLFLSVDIQHNQCPCRFFNPIIYNGEIKAHTERRHRDSTAAVHDYAVLFYFILFYFSCFSLSICFCFCFLLCVFFVSLVHRMRMSCLSHLLTFYSMMACHCIAHCCPYCIPVRGNVVSLWRSFVTTELVSLLLTGLKNRHGHWLWWMSTGRKNGLM